MLTQTGDEKNDSGDPEVALNLMYDDTYLNLIRAMREDNRARKRFITAVCAIESKGVTDQRRIREVIHARARTQSNDEPILWLMRDATGSVYQMIMDTHRRMMQGLTGWLVSIIMLNWAVDLVLGDGKVTPDRLSYEATVGWQDWLDNTRWGSHLGWGSHIHGDPTPERVACRLLTHVGVPEHVAPTMARGDDLHVILGPMVESAMTAAGR